MSDSDKAPAWTVPAMRTGYAARGAVYTVVGVLALMAAIYGGNAQGTQNALSDLKSQSWGTAALVLIALGLICYAAWRVIDAWMDLDRHGSKMKGLAARTGLVITGLIHGALGISVGTMAIGNGGGSGGGGVGSFTGKIMQMPGGQVIVGVIGLGVIGAGVYYVLKGVQEKYRRDIRTTQVTLKLDPAMKAGFIAEGIVVGIIGVLIVMAALTHDPSQAGGVGAALDRIRSAAFGRILLAAIAVGLIGFAIENFVEAVYRIVPARAGDDVQTLARRAKQKAEAAAT
ncbi:DUF1206 domain-containing protein [Allosediminivita pacifica]|uniref:Uncharacterized protein DUF1206 n=1 Tax=Allosediminivita pacifica TaxID=1267769 RepID=A0A2T6A1G9_9RHOB|nr:DUF1206 domain-containing protein [Allosediminivita pacifica]PTX37643.1 uncharacterized protein DUF1206 [Allosediminivita pacifica]GGB29834.1 membrane protein [Allosediminivita pacifica]